MNWPRPRAEASNSQAKMDKVKQILTVLMKHHFWILCALAALVGLIVWNSSVGKLDAEFKRDSATIDSTLSSLKKIESPHPNDTWTEGFGKLTDAQRQQVAAAWEELYKQQKKEVYVWPQSLGKDFQDAVAALDKNPEEKLSDRLRERYQNRVRQEAARLAEIVDAPSPSESVTRSSSEGGEQETRHRVKWPQLVDIQSSFDCEQAPSTQMILYMQEELWVYEALCKVIQSVNEGSKGAHDASITEIDEMAIAYPASDALSTAAKRIMRRRSAAAETPPSGGEAGQQKPDVKVRGREEGRPEGEDGADPDAIWKSWRYVKETGEPLMAGDLAAASPEFNLMPFRLQLRMDPRDLDRLLVACRNSVLPIEVREVRINPGGGTAATAAGGSKPADSGVGASEGHRRMEKVEVSGVAYLIKPFNPQALGVEPAAESGGSEPAEGAAPPAGEAPAGAATAPAETPPAGG